MNPNQIAITPEGRPVVGTILEDKILGTEQTIRVQASSVTVPLIRVSRTIINAELSTGNMGVSIAAGAQYPGATVLAINRTTNRTLTLTLATGTTFVVQPSMSQTFEWTGTAWRYNFNVQTGGTGNEGKFLYYGEDGPEWYSATPIGPETADDLPDGEAKGITTLAGKTFADEGGAATGATTTAKIKGLISAASAANDGLVELATAAEIVTGTDTGRAATPGDLKSALALDGMWLPRRTKAPDAVTYTHKSNFATSVDSWAITGGFEGYTVQSYSGGVLRSTVQTGRNYIAIQRAVTSGIGKYVLLKLRASVAMAIEIKSSGTLRTVTVPTTESWFICSTAMDADSIGLVGSGRSAGDWLEIVDVRIGTLENLLADPFLVATISEAGIQIASAMGDIAGVATKATATLTSTGTAPSDGDTVTIGGKTYTFKTTLGTTEGQVLIGASAAEALDNLKEAINSTGPTATQYCAAANPWVTATTNTDTTQVIEAKVAGLFGNQIAISESSSQLSWANPDGGTTIMARGTDALTQKILALVQNYIAGSGTRPAAAKVELTSTGLIGYETTVDVASGATLTLPAGGTWIWNVYGYGATISSAKRGSSAGGTTLTVAGANASVGYRRYA